MSSKSKQADVLSASQLMMFICSFLKKWRLAFGRPPVGNLGLGSCSSPFGPCQDQDPLNLHSLVYKKAAVCFTVQAPWEALGRKLFAGMLVALLVGPLAGCQAQEAQPTLILATTTSTYDTGLLDVLAAEFERSTGYRVKIIAVGTGEALRLGQQGDADVLLVHAPEAEERFMAQGFGKTRKPVMHNDFVLLGPEADPAALKGLDIVAAFKKIAQAQTLFVSRGDNSGTHQKELALWKAVGIKPKGSWYIEAGQGMAECLRIAHEKRAYILADRGTWLALRKQLALVVLVEGDPKLQNPYHVITVNPQGHPRVNFQGAEAFSAFITSPAVQQMIRQFGQAEHGQPLFIPNAIGP